MTLEIAEKTWTLLCKLTYSHVKGRKEGKLPPFCTCREVEQGAKWVVDVYEAGYLS